MTVLYDGPGDERKALQRMHLKGTAFNLLLTHYHIAISDRPVLAKIQVRSMMLAVVVACTFLQFLRGVDLRLIRLRNSVIVGSMGT